MRAVKDSFGQRSKLWHDWQTVESNLLKKRETESRMQLSGRTEKVPVVKAEIAQLEAQSAQAKLEFEKISENLKKELNVFEEKRVVVQGQTHRLSRDTLAHAADTCQILV